MHNVEENKQKTHVRQESYSFDHVKILPSISNYEETQPLNLSDRFSQMNRKQIIHTFHDVEHKLTETFKTEANDNSASHMDELMAHINQKYKNGSLK